VDTVEAVCNQLARSKLLAPDAVRTIHKRWKSEAKGAADDTGRFNKWLVANGFLTDFQVGVLQRGFADLLFLDDYKLIERIGQGRMAGVYKAIHKLGQVVAVKVLPPSKGRHPPTLARFQREARMASRLKHANVVRTFQVGKTHGGLHYLVMEYLDGETLDDILERRGKLSVAEALHVIAQSLEGLAHIHAEGLVHRDLKPGNLMLVPPPGDTVLYSLVKILDIGLGRALFEDGVPGNIAGDLTNEGAILGTPMYMAPEQARSAHTADIRADIYSLGCVLYHAVTGQPPFPDNSVVRVIVRQATEEVKPLSELLTEVPPGFQEVMDKFLAKDPGERFSSPAEALQALEALQQSTAALAPPETDPGMRTFLTWLETAPPADPIEATPPPAPAKAAAQVGKPAVVPQPKAPEAASPSAETAPFENLTVPRAEPVKVAVKHRAAKAPTFRPTIRDGVAAALGAGALLVLQGVLWLAWRFLF
jgi:eukaryotic-like serine/threonine-protein kinase